MSRMSAHDMTKRVAKPTAPSKAGPVKTPGEKKPHTTVTVPKGGEAHVRKIGNGHLATVRDSNYNTVQETFVPDSGQLRLE